MSHILVVEDDYNLRSTLEDLLELEGYRVKSCENLEQARIEASSTNWDLYLLDVMLPDGNGYEFCRWIRENEKDALILMLTARNLDQDVVEGFVSGADDYVTKPYKSQELLLRVQALLRRRRAVAHIEETFSLNQCTVNWSARSVFLQGQEVHLTKTAFDILRFLFDNKNKVVSRNQILDAVWGEQVYVENRTVDNFVYQLKKTLSLGDESGCYIKSVRGVGYCLVIGE